MIPRSDAREPDRPVRRGFWPLRDLPTVLWLLLTVAAVLAQGSIPAPQWLMIHLLLLGGVTQAILVWSQHFSFALLRARATHHDRRTQNIRLILSNIGALLVCIGIPVHIWTLTAVGASLLIVAVTWHAASLVRRMRRSLAGRFGRTIWYYVASAGMLVVGASIGAIIARGGSANLVLAHALVNLLGWIGVTVAGTVVTLWPTILRTRTAAPSDRRAVQALPWFTAGALVAAAGAVLGLLSVVALGLAGYLAGLIVISISLLQEAKQAVPRSFPALSVGAALLWWIGTVAALLVGAVVTSVSGTGFADFSQLLRAAVPFLVAGFAAQVLVGALSYLVPVVLGGGPAPVRTGTAALGRAGTLRAVLVNAALLVCALPLPGVLHGTASALYLVSMASFLVVLPLAMRAQRQAKLAAEDTASGGASAA